MYSVIITGTGIVTLLTALPLFAQQQPKSLPTDPETVQRMQKRIDELEARLKGVEALEARLKAVEGKQVQVEEQVAEKSASPATSSYGDFGLENVHIRGFGDITHSYQFGKAGDRNRFTLGEFALFFQARLSEHLNVVGDLEFDADLDDHEFEVEVSRLMLEYQPSRYFNVSVGRYFSELSYYNSHYPHGAWTQTTIGRPFFLSEESGLFPVRNLGVSISGLVPSGKLGLHYFAEVSNGRTSNDGHVFSNNVDVFDGKNSKAFVLGLYAQPEWVPGLRVGSAVRYDRPRFVLAADDEEDEEGEHEDDDDRFRGRLAQTIINTHVVYQTPRFEWLNEAFLFLHNPSGAKSTAPVAFYSQLSQQFGNFRPYLRYEYMNGASSDITLRHVGLRHGPSLGVRYDLSTFAGLKLQYDHVWQRARSGINGIQAQVAFAF